jgi:hypothetical protein
VPQLFTPVSISASGKRFIIAAVEAIADSPGRLCTSQIRSSGGNVANGALTVENAFSIPFAILFIQLICVIVLLLININETYFSIKQKGATFLSVTPLSILFYFLV